MTSLTLAVLKELCEKQQLPTGGTKSTLVNRLLEVGIPRETLQLTTDFAITQENWTMDAEVQQNTSLQEATRNRPLTELELLHRERELAQREIQLLRRELEVARLTPNSRDSPVRTRETNWCNVKEMIGNFDGNNCKVGVWVRQVRRLVDANSLDNQAAKALVCHKLTGKALKWYYSKPDCVDMTCDEVLSGLCGMFEQKLSVLSMRHEFEQRVWKTEESFIDYVHEKILLGNRVPVADDEIVEYVIEDIPDKGIRSLAQVRSFETIDELIRAFGKLTLSQDVQQQKILRRKETYQPTEKISKDRREQKELRRVRCFNCNGSGHYATECREPKRERGTCYKCGSPGHKVENCRAPQSSVSYVTTPRNVDDEVFPTVTLEITEECKSFSSNLDALIDSGSPISFVKESCVPRSYICRAVNGNGFSGINGSVMQIVGQIEGIITLNCMKHNVNLRVVEEGSMRNSIVLGRDFMKVARMSVQLDPEVFEIMNIESRLVEDSSTPQLIINENIPHTVREQARQIFEECYVKPIRPEIPQNQNTMELSLTDDKPFYCNPRRLSYAEKSKLKEIIEDLLEKGAIRESTSEYASPIVLAKKKNGELRMCIDFRKLNKVTKRDNFPLPLIEDQLDLLQGKKYFTLLDLKDGFFHIKMHENSIKYTSFVTPLGQYECTKMPFGLKGGPLKFQRYITQIFRDLITSGDVSVYLDDFLIATVTIDHHLRILERVFKLCVANKLELRLNKCKFLQTKLEYLGYVVTSEGIRPTERGINDVSDSRRQSIDPKWPPPVPPGVFISVYDKRQSASDFRLKHPPNATATIGFDHAADPGDRLDDKTPIAPK
ncbi:uncharacterized protein LOC143341206 [Colletes latitarsis]|uniref:uncharacterized protein LOC143341206 n=1 Tax=Colletes latitarsis TaxID=2605962 RepID=UPI0040367E66